MRIYVCILYNGKSSTHNIKNQNSETMLHYELNMIYILGCKFYQMHRLYGAFIEKPPLYGIVMNIHIYVHDMYLHKV